MRLRAFIVALVLPSVLGAQQPDSLVTLTGRVIDDADSGAIAHATLSVAGSPIEGRTDGLGYYHLDGIRLGPHEIVVRALGYMKLTQSVDLLVPGRMQFDVHMMRLPHMLATMVIHGRTMRVPHGFEEIYRRGGRGWGAFITREQIDSMNPIDLKTMLATIPGVIVNDRGVFFQRCSNSWRPQLWIDGQRVSRFRKHAQPDFHTMRSNAPPPDEYSFNELLTGILPGQVQAVEVYRSNLETPAEFADGSGCGVVAVWTLRGP